MADKAFMCKILQVQGTSNPGEVTIQFECCYCKDDQSGQTITLSLAAQVLFTDTLAQMRDKVVAAIDASVPEGYDITGSNTIIMLQFLKV